MHACVGLAELCPLVPCGNHAQLGGGGDAEKLMSTLAYGWVERYGDIASCGTSFASKISILVFKYLHLPLKMN